MIPVESFRQSYYPDFDAIDIKGYLKTVWRGRCAGREVSVSVRMNAMETFIHIQEIGHLIFYPAPNVLMAFIILRKWNND